MPEQAFAPPAAERLLDLRPVPRDQRHPLVFAAFDSLEVGEAMELLNDHDPIPLSMQIRRMRSSQAAWEYIRRGPDVYHVRIRRVREPADSDVPVEAPKPAGTHGL